ncbi:MULTISPECIES: hypothetical protein [Xenorhabdus]|uniref:hypothetical protein n=1 Tax=Xenorhabdus TaxID=626 RepID=UPI0006458FC7|nr:MULTISPECIES: hypothetical protein [Xenorhabdus]MBC8947082.1 hypothetical protein [Xenorhabdus indica]
MLKPIAIALLLFPCALLADSGIYTDDAGKLDIYDGNYFCEMYPAHIFNDPKNLRNFPSGYFPKVMMNISTDGNSKYIGVDLYPAMPMGARPSGSWGYFSASLGTGSRSKTEVSYRAIRDNSNFTYLIGTQNAGIIAALSSSDAFSPVNAVLGRCNRIN